MASKYYTTALAKVAGSSTQFTADIYLADAANVGSYGAELAISGAPANVTYTYTAATLTGFTSLASSEGGISGFSSSTTAGGTFPAAGTLIGSVTVGFAAAPTAAFKLAVRSANLDNLDGVAMPVNWDTFALYGATGSTTPDTTPPAVTTFSPADEATSVAIGSNIVLTFNEAIAKGAGNIVLKTTAGAVVATYDAATSSNITISGSTLTINPTADLGNSTDYKVEFAAGSIKDLAGNSYAGTNSYNFTTAAASTTIPATGSKYYTTPLVKVGDSSTQFTADIYLADAANVGSYGAELAISGAPANVTYTYTAATLTGFTSLASSEGGISGFSSSTTAGGTFPAAGTLIGSVTVGFAAAPTAAFKLSVLSANLDNLDGTAMPVNWDTFALYGANGGTERDTPFVIETYARSISSAVLFIDGDGNWKVGQVGQKVAQYKSVSADAAATVNDDTFELTALTAEARDGGGFLIYGQSNADPSSYSEITLDATGLVTSQRTLTLDQLFAAETKYGIDLNDNGGIGNQLVLADDGEADVYIDGAGAYVVKTPNGQLIPLTLDSQPVTIYSLEDYEFSDVSVEADGSLTSYIEDKSGSLFKMVSSSSGASSTPPQPVSAEELAAREIKTGVDINRDYAKPLTEGWTATLKTASLRQDVEVQLAQSGKIGHAGLVNLLDGVLQNLQSSGATKVGADLVADLRALGARGQALFTSPDLAGNDTSYLSFVFDQMVNSSKANSTFTGGQAKSQSLGNLSADSTLSQLGLLRDKWLLGKDLPNPATQGDTANPNAAAASGVYKTFTAELLVGDASLLDVNQGSAGTCYLMASLAGVANSSASALQATFVSDGTVAGNRVWGVRFFDTQGKEVWVTANDQLAVAGPDATTALYAKATGRDASGAVVPELWVSVVEKAYAQANELGAFARSNDANAMFAIEGGLADAVPNIVGGRMAWVNDQAYDIINGIPLLSAITAPAGSSIAGEVAKAINAGQIVWVGSDNETKDASGATLLTKGHAFLAFDPDPTNPNDTQIRIYNPWGFSAASSANPPGFVSPFLVDLSAVAGVAGYDFYVQVLGSNKDDVIFGTEKGERLEVAEGNDVLRGLGGNDTLVGGLGNDVLMGGPGNDSIDGGEGADKALFSGPRSSYTVSWSASTSAFTVVSAAEGTDTLTGIETLSFSNGSYAASSFGVTPPTIESPFNTSGTISGTPLTGETYLKFTAGSGSALASATLQDGSRLDLAADTDTNPLTFAATLTPPTAAGTSSGKQTGVFTFKDTDTSKLGSESWSASLDRVRTGELVPDGSDADVLADGFKIQDDSGALVSVPLVWQNKDSNNVVAKFAATVKNDSNASVLLSGSLKDTNADGQPDQISGTMGSEPFEGVFKLTDAAQWQITTVETHAGRVQVDSTGKAAGFYTSEGGSSGGGGGGVAPPVLTLASSTRVVDEDENNSGRRIAFNGEAGVHVVSASAAGSNQISLTDSDSANFNGGSLRVSVAAAAGGSTSALFLGVGTGSGVF